MEGQDAGNFEVTLLRGSSILNIFLHRSGIISLAISMEVLKIFFLVQLSHEKIRMGSLGMLLVDSGCGMWILEKGSRKGAVKEKMERHRSSSPFPPALPRANPSDWVYRKNGGVLFLPWYLISRK